MTTDLQVLFIDRQPRRKRLAVHLAGGRTLSITAEVAARFRLVPGKALTKPRLDEIMRVQAREDAMASALRLVAYRPRSEKEMRQALSRRSVSPDLRDDVVSRLRELGLVDDTAFAASFVESRDRSSPRGRRLLVQELRQKGVSREIASQSAIAVDDGDAAYRAAERRATAMRSADRAEFERRLGGFLLRRGFDYGTTREAMRRLWGERANADEDEHNRGS